MKTSSLSLRSSLYKTFAFQVTYWNHQYAVVRDDNVCFLCPYFLLPYCSVNILIEKILFQELIRGKERLTIIVVNKRCHSVVNRVSLSTDVTNSW